MGGALFTTCNIEIYATAARNASSVAEKTKKKERLQKLLKGPISETKTYFVFIAL